MDLNKLIEKRNELYRKLQYSQHLPIMTIKELEKEYNIVLNKIERLRESNV